MSSRILLIDDDKLVHKIAQRQIGKEYELLHAYSAKEGLVLVDSEKPNLILLDIEMPETNGYQLCEQIRADKKYNHIAIVFLSGKSSEKDIMLGYELGGDDYIVKPFHIDVLSNTIKVLEQNQQKNAALKQKAANDAPKPANEFTQVMSFIEDSYSIDCLETLAKRFFTLTNSWGLNCSMMFSHTGNETYFANNNVIKPLEKDIMIHTKNSSRKLLFSCRMIVNYPQVSLLVKNMPVNDPHKYDLYQECLPTLTGTINAKVLALIERQSICQQTEKITDAFSEIKDKLVDLVTVLNSKKGSILKAIESTNQQIDSQLLSLDLPQQAQQQLQGITHTLVQSISNGATDVNTVNKDLASLIMSMQKVVSQQEGFIKDIHQQNFTINEMQPVDTQADYDMEIELL